jgi:hypothetical protein
MDIGFGLHTYTLQIVVLFTNIPGYMHTPRTFIESHVMCALSEVLTFRLGILILGNQADVHFKSRSTLTRRWNVLRNPMNTRTRRKMTPSCTA